jgi:RHS repeat-associated protein
LGRLRTYTAGGATTEFLYDGDRLVGEYNTSGALLRRYVHGPGIDEPLVWYEGSGTSDRRHLIADERGSIVATTGSSPAIYAYGPYGEPSNWSGARFRYTGQIMLPELQLYHYKARAYSPREGRFLQTDPVGYGENLNLYAYVRNDPLNHFDPLGWYECRLSDAECTVIEADRQTLLAAAEHASALSRTTADALRNGNELTAEQRGLVDAFEEHFGRDANSRLLNRLADRIDRVAEFWSDEGPAVVRRADRRDRYSANTAAYQRTFEAAPNIYVNGPVYFAENSIPARAGILFHEGAHKELGYADYGVRGYAWHPEYRSLGIRQRWINADSIACYVLRPCY